MYGVTSRMPLLSPAVPWCGRGQWPVLGLESLQLMWAWGLGIMSTSPEWQQTQESVSRGSFPITVERGLTLCTMRIGGGRGEWPDEGHKARAPCFSRWLWSWPCTKPKPHKDGQQSLVQLQTCASLTSCSWMIVSYNLAISLASSGSTTFSRQASRAAMGRWREYGQRHPRQMPRARRRTGMSRQPPQPRWDTHRRGGDAAT